jgi:hypothetical protein
MKSGWLEMTGKTFQMRWLYDLRIMTLAITVFGFLNIHNTMKINILNSFISFS